MRVRALAMGLVGLGLVAGGGVLVAKHLLRPKLEPAVARAIDVIAGALDRARRNDDATAVRSACTSPKDPCACVELASAIALNENLGAHALGLLERSEQTCNDRAPLPGMKAEALARAGRLEEAKLASEHVTASEPKNAYAHYALALAAFEKLELKNAEPPAQKALEYGRGPEVYRTLGRIALTRGTLDEARAHFLKLLETRPRDTEAAFSAAMCSANMKRYNEAREGFLATLRIDPKHVASRYNLAVVTLQIGAKLEASHHIDKLAQIAPSDPRIPELRKALTTPPRVIGSELLDGSVVP